MTAPHTFKNHMEERAHLETEVARSRGSAAFAFVCALAVFFGGIFWMLGGMR